MSRLTRWAAAFALALSVLALSPSAHAAVAGRSGDIEVFAGWYWPENQDGVDADDNGTYGVRGGFNFTKHFGLEIGAQGFMTEIENPVPFDETDVDAILADLSFEWMANPDDRAVFQLYGGPGYAWVNFDPPTGKDDDDNVVTLHLGVGVKIAVTDTFYIRPDARVRWFDADEDAAGAPDDSHTDLETTIGFGWYLGGGE